MASALSTRIGFLEQDCKPHFLFLIESALDVENIGRN